LEHEIRHDLDPAQAQQVARRALDSYSERFSAYKPEVQWRNDAEAEVAFTVKGMRLEGGLKVEPDRILLNLDVPFVLRPFKRRAFGVIEREVRDWLAKAKAGAA
jgi:hypothetical protein